MNRLLAALFALFISTAALADQRNFWLENRTSNDIIGLAFSSDSAPRWNWTRNAYIASGDGDGILFDRSGDCYLNLKLRFSDGSTYEWMNEGLDFCSIYKVRVIKKSYGGISVLTYE